MLRDTWLVFLREWNQRKRQSVWLVVGLLQPLLYMFFYGPLVTRILPREGPQLTGWGVLVPALLLQAGVAQSMFVGLSLLIEYRAGVLERLRVAPISRVALLLGKLANTAVSVAGLCAVVTLVCVLVFRWRPPLDGIALSIGLTVLVAVSLAACSYSLALRTKNEQALAVTLNAALLPLLLLSGSLLPITPASGPHWLYWLSRLNPIAYELDADRAALRGELLDRPVLLGSSVVLALLLLALTWGTRTFARETDH